jgi:hypothetical protein
MKKEVGLNILSFRLNEKILEEITIYGFKVNECFKDMLIDVQLQQGTPRNKLKWASGRTILKVAATLYPNQVIHFHGGLNVIEANQDFWFYTLNPMNLEDLYELEAHVTEWLAREQGLSLLELNLSSFEEWGVFEPVNLIQLKDKTLFKNGYSVIEKTFLSYLLDRNIPFLDGAPQLSFHRMISESGSSVMSLPYFPKKGTPYSYALDATLTTIPNTEILLLEFKTYIKVWIVEKPNNAFNQYFKESKTTNAYFYTPLTSAAIPSETTPKSFNQISLRKKKEKSIEEVIPYKTSDQYFCEQLGININQFLEKELLDFNLNETQLLITLPNKERDRFQKISTRKKSIKPTQYGLGLPEKEIIFEFISSSLQPLGLHMSDPLSNIGGNVIKTDTNFNRINLFNTYGLEDFLLTHQEELAATKKKKNNKKNITLPKKFFNHAQKTSLTIGLFVSNSWLQKGLIGFTRALLGASEVIDAQNHHYQREDGFSLRFILFKESISKEIVRTETEMEIETIIHKLIKTHPFDSCFIEIGDFKGKKGDPKFFLRTLFAEMGIPTQFIFEPTSLESYELKMDVINRTLAASKDLLAKNFFVEKVLETELTKSPFSILIGLSKIKLDNGFQIPCLTKVEGSKVSYKVYPYTSWIEGEKIYKTLGRDYVLNLESCWGNPKKLNREEMEKQRLILNREKTDWLKIALIEFKDIQNSISIFWDSRIEDQLARFDISKLNNWIETELGLDLTQTTIIHWSPSTKSPSYLTYKKAKEDGTYQFGKLKGIYQSNEEKALFYLIGDRPNSGSGLNVMDTKWERSSAFIIVQGMHQIYILSKRTEKEQIEIAKFVQKMRKMVITQDIEASIPFPLYIIRHLNELLDALFIYHK